MRDSETEEDPREGEPCDICGDVGYADFLVTCSNCCLSRQHIYCMLFNLCQVPESWHCEVCQLQNDILLPKSNLKFCPDDSTSNSNERVSQKTKETNGLSSSKMAQVDTSQYMLSSKFAGKMQSSGKMQKMLGAKDDLSKTPAHKTIASPVNKTAAQSLSRYNASKGVETGKVKFLPTEYVLRLKAGENPKASTMCRSSSSRPGSVGTSHCPPSQKTSSIPPITSLRSAQKKCPTHGSLGHSKPLTVASMQANTHKSVLWSQALPNQKSPLASENLKKRKIDQDRSEGRIGTAEVTTKKSDESLLEFDKSTGKQVSVNPSRSLGKKGPADAFLDRTLTGIWNSKLLLQFPEEIPNPPAVDATWKGSFKIIDKDCPGELYTRFWAHPPEKLSRKAYEVSKQMPEILQFKLHRRCDRWPDVFHKDGPSNFDIALYFFPFDFARSKEKYICLLELIEKQDLMMQSCLDGVELLIFTSKQLPVDSQRLYTQFYLWGVFRAGKSCSSSFNQNKHKSHVPSGKPRNVHHPINITHEHEHDTAIMDMEIDMMGGKDIGRVDKPCRRRHSSCYRPRAM